MDDKKRFDSNKFEEVLKGLLTSLSEENDRSIKEKYEALTQEQQEMLSNKNNNLWLQIALQNFSGMVAYARKLPTDSPYSIALVNGTLERFFSRYMSEVEGSGCSVDKSTFICRKIGQSLQENANLTLFADYTGLEQIKPEEWKKQAYWSPKTIKDTDEAKKIYWDWYMLKHLDKEKSTN